MQVPSSGPAEESVGGRYELIEPVGEGNFSVTYRARDAVLGRMVAVKLLRPQFAADPNFVSRFEREARVAASVSHPNVVDVYDFGPYGSTFYIAMQYVAGRTLKQELDAHGPFDPADAVRITSQILRGLAAIHAAGIIHRDIKPQNVLLGRDGAVRVTDFGVAHYPLHGALTTHGTTVGTASYMAPEQARGAALSAQTDLYAVGVVLFELLTGRLPFEADNPMAVMLAHLQQAPPLPSDVAPDASIPAALETEVMRALDKNPGLRPTSADDMDRALHLAIGPLAPAAPADIDRPSPDVMATERLATAPALSMSEATATIASRPKPVAGPVGGGTPRPPAPAMRPLPSAKVRRRPAAWLAPLVLFLAALVAVGALVASGNFFRTNDGGASPTRAPAATLITATKRSTPSPSPTPSPSAPPTKAAPTRTSLRAIAPAVSTATALPSPAPTVAPIATSVPTETPTPEPTVAPPTATSTPNPTATFAPEPPTVAPTSAPPEPVVPDSGGVVGGLLPNSEPDPTPAPVSVDRETDTPSPDAGGTFLTFTARDWRGAFNGDPEWFGRPWVAIYGQQSAYPSATLHFELPSAPSGRLALTVTGLGDESGAPFPFEIQVNRVPFGRVEASFPNWDPKLHGQHGENAPWGQIQVIIPADVFQAGNNDIEVSSLAPGTNVNAPPYMLLSDATLAPADETAAAMGDTPADSVRLESVRLDDKGKPQPAPAPKPAPSAKTEKSGSGSGQGKGKEGDKKQGGG